MNEELRRWEELDARLTALTKKLKPINLHIIGVDDEEEEMETE